MHTRRWEGGSRGWTPARLTASVAVVLLLWCVPALATGQAKLAFRITDGRITESSGLAADPVGNRYWTVNDSGDGGVVYALDPSDGKVEGTLRYQAQPTDVEALAMQGDRLYIGDIGDNGARRRFVTVYFFDAPWPQRGARPYRSMDFVYPDGPHDAETLLVSPEGRLYLVTKELKGSVYRAPKNPKRDAMNRLTKVGPAPPYVTDGTFLPGGKAIALRTYVSVEVLDAKTYEPVASVAAPRQPQGESISVALSEKTLLLGSEGKDSKVYRIAIPTRLGKDVPSAGAAPPAARPSPSATSAPPNTEDEPEQTASTPDNGRSGTLLALALAGLLALISGLVVVVVKKP